RFFVGVISGEEIGEQFVVLVNWIDRFTEKPRLAAQAPHRRAIGRAITANDKWLFVLHRVNAVCSLRRPRGKYKRVVRRRAARHDAVLPDSPRPRPMPSNPCR